MKLDIQTLDAKKAGSIDLDDVKAIGRATGSTVNDVLMGALAGALRRWRDGLGMDREREALFQRTVNLIGRRLAAEAGIDLSRLDSEASRPT